MNIENGMCDYCGEDTEVWETRDGHWLCENCDRNQNVFGIDTDPVYSKRRVRTADLDTWLEQQVDADAR